MSTTFRQSSADKHLHYIEGWMRELEFYESEIGSCVWSLEQFTPDLTRHHLRLASDRFRYKFDEQRAQLANLNAKLRRLHRRLARPHATSHREELLEKSFNRLNREVDICRKRFNKVLPEFDNFLRSFESV